MSVFPNIILLIFCSHVINVWCITDTWAVLYLFHHDLYSHCLIALKSIPISIPLAEVALNGRMKLVLFEYMFGQIYFVRNSHILPIHSIALLMLNIGSSWKSSNLTVALRYLHLSIEVSVTMLSSFRIYNILDILRRVCMRAVSLFTGTNKYFSHLWWSRYS